jgi:hypothetical protein
MFRSYDHHQAAESGVLSQAVCLTAIDTIIDASKEVGLEINVEKTKYMLLCQQNVVQNRDTKIANRWFVNVS